MRKIIRLSIKLITSDIEDGIQTKSSVHRFVFVVL